MFAALLVEAHTCPRYGSSYRSGSLKGFLVNSTVSFGPYSLGHWYRHGSGHRSCCRSGKVLDAFQVCAHKAPHRSQRVWLRDATPIPDQQSRVVHARQRASR